MQPIPLIANINQFILQPLILLMLAAAVVYFVWAATKVVSASVDEKAKATQHLIWGIVGPLAS